MASSSSSCGGGIGVVGAIGVVFVTLKLCGVIDWSWWCVLLPFYGGLAVVLVLALILCVFVWSFDKKQGWK